MLLKIIIGYFILCILPNLYQYIFRDKEYDYRNYLQNGDLLKSELSLLYSLKDAKSTITDKIILWKNESLLVEKKKGVINQAFEIPITEGIRKNTSFPLLYLKFEKLNCQNFCPTMDTYSRLIKWDDFSKYNLHYLLPTQSNNDSAIKKDTDHELKIKPYIYNTVRFDLNVEPQYNIHLLSPWNFKYFDNKIYPKGKLFVSPLNEDTFFNIDYERRIINLTRENFTINVEFNMRDGYLWSFKNLFEYSIDGINSIIGKSSSFNIDHIKRFFLSSNPFLLRVTLVASILEFIFKTLAFEKDIAFWVKKDSFKGVSLRSIILTLIQEIIIFLYLTEEANILVLYFQIAGIVIELWKILKLITFCRRFPFFKVKDEYQGETDEADQIGTKYLIIILIPLILIFSIYQILFVKFRSIKSYIIKCATGSIFAFGFLSMMPQLYVNYKLKTVAGMSRNAMVYKFISTFIDDLYSFLEDLPLMYKIACFRDDIIYVIWLYQCYLYPVDPTRANEYGYVQKADKNEESNENQNKNDEEEDQDVEKKVKTD